MVNSLKETIKGIKGDIRVENSFIRTFLRDYFLSASFRVLLNYRLGKFFSTKRYYLLKLIGLRYRYKLIKNRGCDISHNSIIGRGLRLPHPIGVVIGDGVKIEDQVVIFQNVTIGSHGKTDREKTYPSIGKGVKIYAGARIIGGLTIGEGAVIAANAVVNKDVRPGDTGICAKILLKVPGRTKL